MIMFAGMAANAQTEAGKILISGNTKFSFSSSGVTPNLDGNKGDETTTTTIGLKANGGLFIMDNLAVGGILDITSTKVEVEDSNDDNDPMTNTSIGVFGRYYLLDGNFKPYGEVMLGYSAVSYSDDDAAKYGGLMYGLGLGGTYFVNEYVGIDVGIQYSASTLTNKKEDKIEMELSNITFGLGVVVTL